MKPNKLDARVISELLDIVAELRAGQQHSNASLAEMIRMRIIADMRATGEIE